MQLYTYQRVILCLKMEVLKLHPRKLRWHVEMDPRRRFLFYWQPSCLGSMFVFRAASVSLTVGEEIVDFYMREKSCRPCDHDITPMYASQNRRKRRVD